MYVVIISRSESFRVYAGDNRMMVIVPPISSRCLATVKKNILHTILIKYSESNLSFDCDTAHLAAP